MSVRHLLILLSCAPLLWACSDSTSGAPCEGGTYQECACESGTGQQICIVGSWDDCLCPDTQDAGDVTQDANPDVPADLDTEDGASNIGLDGAADGELAADLPMDVPCECPVQAHCNEDGVCEPDLCTKGLVTCATLHTLKICHEDGSGHIEEDCPEGDVCFGGVCTPPVCEPNAVTGCLEGALAVCNSIGTGVVKTPCAAGLVCQAGVCEPVPPNVILLIDTSGSMNWTLGGMSPDDCSGSECPTWWHPNCDNGAVAYTRLGKVKQALNAVIASPDAGGIRFALQRFAQVPFPSPTGFGFLQTPGCDGGYWDMPEFNLSLIGGDDDGHYTSSTGWFGQGLGQIIAHGFPAAGAMDLTTLMSWFDGTETANANGAFCLDSSSCAGGPCLSNSCAVTTNPELRAVGATPVGKSLFYAGEYLRHFVLVEGLFCSEDADCGSSNHTCVDGQCHDPMGYCRENVIILFSDGSETENVHIDDFFHPRVQAKRLFYGLGCQGDEQCLSGAACVQGVCRPPEGLVDEAAMVCETGGAQCANSIECPDPCITWDNCQGYCTPTSVDYVDAIDPANRLTDAAGVPRAVRVHVVDASGVEGQNQVIATYGGGVHVSVDLADPEELLATVTNILGGVKDANACGSAE